MNSQTLAEQFEAQNDNLDEMMPKLNKKADAGTIEREENYENCTTVFTFSDKSYIEVEASWYSVGQAG